MSRSGPSSGGSRSPSMRVASALCRASTVGLLLAASTTTLVLCKAEKTLYDFTVKAAGGQDVPLSSYKNKPVVLVVNVASECGYTHNNYVQLQELYTKYSGRGLEVLAFPCNQFGQQEPASDEQIQKWTKQHYGVTFPVLAKVDVNGPSAPPLFDWLKRVTPWDGPFAVEWNFSKWLVVHGVPRQRYGHGVPPKNIQADIEQALQEVGAAQEL